MSQEGIISIAIVILLVISGLIGLIYRSIGARIDGITRTVDTIASNLVYKDTCQAVRSSFERSMDSLQSDVTNGFRHITEKLDGMSK